jgi:AmiR/NasT family two-component response regulator
MDKHGMAEAEAFSFIQKRAMGERITMRVVAQRVIEGDIKPGS